MLPSLPIPEKMWERVGEMLFHLRQVGYSIPFQDVVIAVLALEYDTKIWTTDKHFIMMQQVAPMLKLFVE
jgi:predicted nucleic acid-binding protein